MGSTNSAPGAWHLALAPAVWLAHFVLVYVVASLACAASRWWAAAHAAATLGVIAATAAALGACVYWAIVHWRAWTASRGQIEEGLGAFLARTSFGLHALAIVGIVWVALPVFLLAPCAS